MSYRVLPAAERTATAWRNGGGITREIAASPAGAALADFDWRISMAEVEGTSPFSTFPGVDRILTVIAGTLALAIEGRAKATLAMDAPPYRFAGEDICVGTAIGGAATDLNVMTRRSAVSADVRRCHTETLIVAADVCVLVAIDACRVVLREHGCILEAHDAMLMQNERNSPLSVSGRGLIIEFRHES